MVTIRETESDRPEVGKWPGEAVFCSQCGTRLRRRLLYGRERGWCPQCGRIDFRAPQVGVAALVRDERGRVLMVKRGPEATQPGKWSLPAGFMDYGEGMREAAVRELREETGLEAEMGDPVHAAANFHDPEKLSVCIWFAAAVTGGELAAGSDAADAGWFPPDDPPELAFETDAALLRRITGRGKEWEG